jgi:pectin methylesterase-like acyl-CoA thioesterase
VFYLAGALARGEDYHVTIEAGALSGPDGAFAIADATTWRFSTAASGPSDRAKLSVAVSGGAPFCTVQAALDAVPANNTTPTAIELASGTYHEVLYVRGKDNLTLRGADRKRTVIAAVNNNNLNPATRTRALVGVDDASGLVVETLTIHNLTPQGGSQAEALRLQGCDRCVVRDADILSLQDTLLWSGRLYAEDCLIAGNVDFIWGTGAAYFTRCEIKTVGRAGYIVQARNGAAGNGYVFVDSKLTSDAGITGNVLGRVDASVYPQSHVAYVDCELGAHISAAGWTVTGGAGSALRFWEYGSKSPSGQPIDTSQRHAASTQLTSAQAEMMRDPAMVLGGWQPPVR